ncbi:MAG: hypothetical protein AAF702_07350 [Chloroflexota bacterium]
MATTKAIYLPHGSNMLRWGVRAVEPNPDAGHAIRGNLYIFVELVELTTGQAAELDNSDSLPRHSNSTEPESLASQTQPEQETISASTNSSASYHYSTRELAQFAERLLGLIQTTYYTAKGSQSVATERAIKEVHHLLSQHNTENPQAPLRAGVLCAALLKNRLSVTCSGPALALIASDDALEQFPWNQYSSVRDLLGSSQMPEIFTHRRAMHGDVSIFIGTVSWLEQLTVRKILGTVAQCTLDNCEEIAAYLTEESKSDSLPALLISAAVPQTEAPPGSVPIFGDGITNREPANFGSSDVGMSRAVPSSSDHVGFTSSTQQAHQPVDSTSSSLPTSVHASPPIVDGIDPLPPSRSEERWNRDEQNAAVDELTTSFEPTMEQTAVHLQGSKIGSASNSDIGLESGAQQAISHGASVPVTSVNAADETAKNNSSVLNRDWGKDWQSLSSQVKSFVADLLPDQLPRGREQEDATAQLSTNRGATAQRPVADPYSEFRPKPQQRSVNPITGSQAAPLPPEHSEAPDDFTTHVQQKEVKRFTPPPPAAGSRARLIITLAVVLSFLVILVVYATVWWQGAERARQVEELIAGAEGYLNNAKISLDENNSGAARVSLQSAQQFLVDAELIGGPRNQIDTLLAQISQELSGILQVTPLYGLVEPLVVFPFDVSPHRILVVDQDIYVLDTGKHQILRYRLDETRSSIPDQNGSSVLAQGQNVDSAVVGPLVDIAWQEPIPGIEDKANLLVLDSNHNIFRYNQQVDGPSLLTFGEQDQWQTPTQIEVYLGRFYVADGGRGQIFRYERGLYTQAPEPWLVATNPPALSGISSMTIDGDIWILLQEGLLLPYSQGIQRDFVLDDDVGIITEPVDLFVGAHTNSYIYLADAGEDRILIFSKSGAYIQQLKAPEENTLQNLRGIYVDELSKTIYLLTQAGLFQHPLPD